MINMVNKKLVIIVTIIAIIVVAGIVYFNLNREAQEQYTFSEQNVENQVENDVESNTIVKDNSIKKWFISYGLPGKVGELKEYIKNNY